MKSSLAIVRGDFFMCDKIHTTKTTYSVISNNREIFHKGKVSQS